MIIAQVVGGREIEQRLNNITPNLRNKLDQKIERLAIMLTAYVKGSKLSGQVLKNRTGTLRRSINYKIGGKGTNNISATVGTNIEYARIHEFGFHGAVSIKAHMRMQVMAFGKAMKNPHSVSVRAHTANVNFPERSFLRSALDDKREQIKIELMATLKEVVKK